MMVAMAATSGANGAVHVYEKLSNLGVVGPVVMDIGDELLA